MAAFDPISKDIDDTLPGRPYVPDSSGWGWFMLFLLAAIPFLIIGTFTGKYAVIVTNHPVLISIIYLIISLVLGLVVYRSTEKTFRFFGVLATIITMLPFAIVQVVYAIPYILTHDGLVTVALTWLLVSAVMLGGTVFVMVIFRLFKSGIPHFIASIIFLAITIWQVHPPRECTWEMVRALYQVGLH